jgi:hypothetical protein
VPYSDPARQREYQRQWIAKRRADWLAENGPCVDCGSWSNLDVDHVKASLKVTHRIWSWSDSRRAAELEKCVARCEPCHIAKTIQSQEFSNRTSGPGESHSNAKLTDADVLEIRASSLTDSHLAELYGVGRTTITTIKLRRSWKHLP